MSLHKLFIDHAGKTLYKWMHYLTIYERHFGRFVGKSPVVLEFGVSNGGSLEIWREWFGPGTKVIGVDIEPICSYYAGKDIEIFTGSQADPGIIEAILQKYPVIDIVVDDGSHRMEDMKASFNLLYHRMSPTGVYAVEDTHTCYLDDEKEKWGGGLKDPDSFMEFVKDLIDLMHAHWTKDRLQWTSFTHQTDSINIYDSIVVFERREQAARQCLQTFSMLRG